MENIQNTSSFWIDLNENISTQTVSFFNFLIIIILQPSELLQTNEMLCSVSLEDKLIVSFCLLSF